MRFVVWAGLAVVIAVLAVACGGEEPVASSGESAAAVTGPTTKTQRESLDGVEGRAPAPDVAGATLAGESISLAELRGGPVFVKVFGGY